MTEAPKMAFAHMGIYVIDTSEMVDFYTRVLGFCITDRALIRGASVVLLTRDPEEHHQIVRGRVSSAYRIAAPFIAAYLPRLVQ